MSKQVDFYLISNQVGDAKFKLASRLCNKIQKMDQKTLVVTDNAAATKQLDNTLWSFSDTSFVAHDVAQVGAVSNVHITETGAVTPEILATNYDVLVNLASEVPAFNHHFERVAEIVEQDESQKAQARVRFKNYKAEGFELKTHNIEL